MAGKGCEIVFDQYGLPDAHCAAVVRQSLTLFDERASKHDELLYRAGTPLPMTPSPDNADRALLVCFRIAPQLIEAPVSVDEVTAVRIRAQFQPQLVSVDRLRDFNQRFAGQRWWQPEAVPLTLFLALASHVLFHLPNAAVSLAQFGYLTTGIDVLQALWHKYCPAAVSLTEEILGVSVTIRSIETLLDELRALKAPCGHW
jgi:hypothetical protein